MRDRRDDAKFNVAEIGGVNMGEIGAVRKRSYWPTCLTDGHMVVNDHTRSAENVEVCVVLASEYKYKTLTLGAL